MKRNNFNRQGCSKITVICKSDGDIAYCNALAVDGTCKCDDCYCKQAVAVITEREYQIQVRDIITGKVIPSVYMAKQYIALED